LLCVCKERREGERKSDRNYRYGGNIIKAKFSRKMRREGKISTEKVCINVDDKGNEFLRIGRLRCILRGGFWIFVTIVKLRIGFKGEK
jgi:hypothetical protein